MNDERFNQNISNLCSRMRYMTKSQLVDLIVTITKCAGWHYEQKLVKK